MGSYASHLQNRINDLEDENKRLKAAFDASIQGGLEFKRRFEAAYFLMQSIEGINSHPKWLEVQAFLQKFDVIDTATYGKMVIPK